jgi:hypothetical protein
VNSYIPLTSKLVKLAGQRCDEAHILEDDTKELLNVTKANNDKAKTDIEYPNLICMVVTFLLAIASQEHILSISKKRPVVASLLPMTRPIIISKV